MDKRWRWYNLNTPAGGSGHIHMNSAAGGGIAFTFNPVNGDTGISKTNVSKLNDGAAFGYDQVLTDGYTFTKCD
jgi:hypothetical protein